MHISLRNYQFSEGIKDDVSGTEEAILGLIDSAEKMLEPSKPPQCAEGSEKVAQVS